jgi:hypothetical protein
MYVEIAHKIILGILAAVFHSFDLDNRHHLYQIRWFCMTADQPHVGLSASHLKSKSVESLAICDATGSKNLPRDCLAICEENGSALEMLTHCSRCRHSSSSLKLTGVGK